MKVRTLRRSKEQTSCERNRYGDTREDARKVLILRLARVCREEKSRDENFYLTKKRAVSRRRCATSIQKNRIVCQFV